MAINAARPRAVTDGSQTGIVDTEMPVTHGDLLKYDASKKMYIPASGNTFALSDFVNGKENPMATELKKLKSASGEVAVTDAESRLGLFKKAYDLRRRIALSNPLLDFDDILFIKRHRATFNHMLARRSPN